MLYDMMKKITITIKKRLALNTQSRLYYLILFLMHHFILQ